MDSQRILSIGMTGSDVARLHEALETVGVDVAEDERESRRFGDSTHAAVTRLQMLVGLEPTGAVDAATLELALAAQRRVEGEPARDPGHYVVEGPVTDGDGRPVTDAVVAAFRLLLREEVEVGRAQTDEHGQYHIEFVVEDAERGASDVPEDGIALRLRLLDAEEREYFDSGVRYAIPQHAIIPLAQGGPGATTPSEFDRTLSAISARLGGLRLEQLEENPEYQDLTFLGNDAGVGRVTAAYHSIAARLEQTTELPAQLFYGLFRQNVPADAAVRALAASSDGTDLDGNAQRLLDAVLTASAEVRATAVDAAVADGTMAPSYAQRAEEDLERLKSVAVDAALQASGGMGKTAVDKVLATAAPGVPDGKRRAFMERWSTSSTSARAFWRDLAKDEQFSEDDVAGLRFAMVVGRFSRGHLPLIDAVTKLRGDEKLTRAGDLARLNVDGWKRMIEGDADHRGVGIPDNFTARDGETAVDAYARLLERSFERAYPTVAFAARLADDAASPLAAKGEVVSFLEANPNFDLRRTSVDRFLHDNPEALRDERDDVRDSLLVGQRLLKIAPRYAVAKPLLADGITSAQQVYSMGGSRFTETYGAHPDIGLAEAERVFGVAEQTYAASLMLQAKYGAMLRQVNPAAVGVLDPGTAIIAANGNGNGGAPAPSLEPFPNLGTLFGSLDLCACTHCRSVLSPAAYFTDILRFLAQRKTNGISAKQVLLARRPDLAQIELSCPNTNTVLPYIDLVNELLEDAVAPPANPLQAMRRRQTTLDTPELNANPQYVNDDAYDRLAKAVHPWGLPFNLRLLEARTYLGQLGSDRPRLTRALNKPAEPRSAESVGLAIEELGLSTFEASIIKSDLVPAPDPWSLWGLSETGNSVQDPVETTKIHQGTWLQVLAQARVLLARAELTHAELQRLLNTRFINPAGTVKTSAGCDLSVMTVDGLDAGALDRLHRFVRLQRRLGWDAYDLDTAITRLQSAAPATGPLNDKFLRQLAVVTYCAARFDLAVADALALVGGIDTYQYPALPGEDAPRPSLYDRLLQNPAVLNPVDPVFALNVARSEIAATPLPKLAEHLGTLVAAFELSDIDVTLAISELAPGDDLTLEAISSLYREVLLSRGLGVTIKELMTLRALAERAQTAAPGYEDLDPFDANRPELLREFCETVDAVRATRFSIAQLDYLLCDQADPGSGLRPDPVGVGTQLKSIRDGLLKIKAENAPAPDPTGALVRTRLSALLTAAEDVDPVMALLDGTSTLSDADQSTLVADKLGPFVDIPVAQARLVGAAALDAGPPRYEYVLQHLTSYARTTLSTGLVVQQLADTLGLPTAVLKQLATWLTTAAGASLLDEFLALGELDRAEDLATAPIDAHEANFTDYFPAYARLDKAAQVIAGHGLTAAEVDWYRDNGDTAGWLDLTALPAAPAPLPEGRFLRWTRVARAERVKAALAADTAAFGGMFLPATTKAEQFTLLETRLKWSVGDLEVLAGASADTTQLGSLGLTFPDDYTGERALHALLGAFAEVSGLGVSATAAVEWIGSDVTAAHANAIKQSVKAKYTTAQWPEIAKPLRDVLREAQRDALVAYLLAAAPPAGARRWQTPDDLYAHYLIDVEMCACAGTSRIVQASAAVQLFVQRCALNLEQPDVNVDAKADGSWLEWKWMSRYRVWEANRKVFLYPENWIEPSLRRDKSSFFADLEGELLQNEITADAAERGLRNYLVQLDGVARLDVVGTYFEAGTPNRFHVIGRKPGNPPTYYHREWIDSSRWTGWTKVELDILGDHVLPVVWNRRLYLFWAVINRRADTTQTMPKLSPSNDTPPETSFHLEVELAWSELRDGKWQAKQTAPQTFVITQARESRDVILKSSIADPLLRVDLFLQHTGQERVGSTTYVTERREHMGQFVLGGVGNTVEVYAADITQLGARSPATYETGKLAPALHLNDLAQPTASQYYGMRLGPTTTSVLSGARQRVAPCNTSYDLYGQLISETVLAQADRYRLLIPHQLQRFDSSLPFFYADSRRSYFVIPQTYYQNGNYFEATAPAYVYRPNYRAEYRFTPNYHAFVPLFIRQLNAGGVDRLYERDLQRDPATLQTIPSFDFRTYYKPTDKVLRPYPIEGVDFAHDAPYAIYNWELFYHAPFEIGEALSTNQRFEEAKHWYEYIFDPTSAVKENAPQRYWVTKPFHEMTGADYQAQEISGLMSLINARDTQAEHQVAQWRANPFDPHVIAGLRPVAYQRAIVMKYIDNLVAWGDQLFRQDTLESVNEAAQLYVLAAELLGPRPELIKPASDAPPKTYAELEPDLDKFSNAATTAAENVLAPVQVNVPTPNGTPPLPLFPPLYFCVPPNEKLLGYWDTVADRLFKIRHCMNIEGVTRQLALFAPPIDPGMLVRAAAAGLDLGSVLNDSLAPLPPYRFNVVLREAAQLADDVRGLGSELLGALERRDAEKLSLIRASTERRLQKAQIGLRKLAIHVAETQLDGLETNREVAEARLAYLDERKDDTTNEWEAASLVMTGASIVAQSVAMVLDTTSGAAHAIPEVQAGASGAGGSPHLTVKIGGPNVGRSTSGFAKVAKVAAAVLQTGASMSSVLGGYQRRKQEWGFQHGLAGKEIATLDAQKVTLEIQKEMATRELANETLSLELIEQTDELLRERFTNQELYDWMLQQISATYFQSYRLAYGVARKAEACMRRELGLKPSDTSYIQFGYWDSLKKGLLAGEKLAFDLKRMESAYLASNARELELVKHVSLLQVDPTALVDLRTKHKCVVAVPELLFDLDTPGHYMRRLKAVTISVPCVAGPYVNVRLTATLHNNEVRVSPDGKPSYGRDPADDPRFVDDQGGFSTIVTSSAQNDPGLFELAYDDDRYLPFEGCGAAGIWELKLGSVYPQFDYSSISDVVLHLHYTARDGGEPLAVAASAYVKTEINKVALTQTRKGLYQLLSPRQELPSQWQGFLQPSGGGDQVLAFDLGPSRFPFFTHGLDIGVKGIDVYATLAGSGSYTLELTRPNGPAQTLTLVSAGPGQPHHATKPDLQPASPAGRAPSSAAHPWTLKIKKSGAANFRSLTAEELSDLAIIFQYEVKE
jgi:hypothetical protein